MPLPEALTRLALATAATMPKPDPESHLLVEALRHLGIAADLLPWDAPVAWEDYPLVVIRTPWDYFERLDEFLAWCRRVEEVTRLANPRRVVEWNSHKRYLAGLPAADLPTVPTLHLPQGCRDGSERLLECGWEDVVIKPAVSIGAIGALRAAADSPTAAAHLAGLLEAGDVLVQPFLESIADAGEVSLVYFGGIFSHAIRKLPRPGDYRVQDLYGGSVHAHRPKAIEIEIGAAALRAVPAPTAYARIDLVRHGGRPAIMEMELIEPELFLGADPGAARRYAETLAALLAA